MYNQPYGYNPYYQNKFLGVPQQQPMQQPLQNSAEIMQNQVISGNRPTLSGKLVPDLETVKGIEFPLDGSVSYYPLTDGSAIVTKQLQLDGTSKTVVYKPIQDTKEEIKYITQEDMKKALDGLNFEELDDIKDEIKEIRQEVKELKKKKKDE